jgi:hypothetical protein
MTLHRPLPIAAVLTAVAAIASPALAQSIGVSAVSATTDHRLFRGQLRGIEGRIGIPLGRTGLRVHLSADRVRGDATRTGSTCVGLTWPGVDCPPEPLREDSELMTATAGLGIRAVSWRGLSLDIGANYRLGWAESNTHSLVSSGRLHADKNLRGIGVGIDAGWKPMGRWPLTFEVGLTRGSLTPRQNEGVIDGYSPLENDIEVTRVRLGVAWIGWLR